MRYGAALTLLLTVWCGGARAQGRYYGKDLGALSELHHGVRGRVYAVDSRTLFIKDFNYDGEGPSAYFYVGTAKTPSNVGALRLRDERGGSSPLRRYRGEGVTLSLPDGKTLRDFKWFSVYCDEYSVNFGDVSIPRELDYPKPAKVGALRGVHGVSSDPVVVVDAQTLLVPNFSYDGEAPDAKFWVGRGDKPSPQGIRIPDENGKEAPLRKYDGKTIVLTLPGELTVFDIGHFAVWCEAFTVNFGHVTLPHSALANVPPSLKMLGVSPQSKLNCEVLYDELAFEVRWAVAGDSIVLQLVAKLEDGEYMSFGISGNPKRSQMIGGDVAVAWINMTTFKGESKDYYLEGKSQCAGQHGACPDEKFGGESTNSIRLLNAALVNGYSIVTYQRSLRAADYLDLPVLTNASQPVIWALGPLNSHNEVSYHHHYNKDDKFIEFGRPPIWNCPMPEGEDDDRPTPVAQKPISKQEEPPRAVIKPNPVPTPKPVPRSQPWDIPAIQCYEPPDGVFYAQMGPTGGKQGYSAITGHVGWGLSWYINGLLIPEINVVRGKKYTFVVEGGSNPEVPARYHPFYITNDPVGGYLHKNDKEREGIEIYAGVRRSRTGELLPTGVGRACNWTPDINGPEADEYPSFGAYQRSLTLECEPGNPGIVTWTPDRRTPDTVYYQCFTHRHLGWKINVLDECDAAEAEESRVVEQYAVPEGDLQSEESIQVHSRVPPDSNFLDQRKKVEKIINTKINYNDFSSIKGDSSLSGDTIRTEVVRNQIYPSGQEYELPISKVQIKEVIQAVESLESQMKEEMRKNTSHSTPSQYQVHEELPEMFVPELPIREGEEYIIEPGKLPDNYMLPPNQKPLTLQSVLRPSGPNRPMGNVRPPYRRPVPPEIKLRRPPPMFQKGNGAGYPLSMPNPHGPQGMQKKPLSHKHSHYPNSRLPPSMNRPHQAALPPMKVMPPLHHDKVGFSQGPPKQIPKLPTGTVQSIIMGKPASNNPTKPTQSQMLNLGQTDIIVNHVVKSQITLPGTSDAVAQHSIPQVFFNKPSSGQIILGKPMDNPQPLDQQMTQTKHQIIRTHPTSIPTEVILSTTHRTREENKPKLHIQDEIKSSDFIGESVPNSSTLKPAVNTGFKVDSIVIESGFKPIIREPLMAAEDRITDGDETNNTNRREDTDVEEDYNESPQYINHAYPSEKQTESFEPMFIPSPPDHLLSTNDRTKEIFPKNHAKEDRPHPVYVKSEEQLNALFSKTNLERDVPSDMVMESDRISPYYLPPDPKINKEQSQKLTTKDEQLNYYTTYDGKNITKSSISTVPEIKTTTKLFSSKLPANPELLLKTPQYGPFIGELPPLVSGAPPIGELTKDQLPDNNGSRTTHLKLVNAFQDSEDLDLEEILSAKASKHYDVIKEAESKNIEDNNEENNESDEEYEEDEEEEEQKDTNVRDKRDTKTTQFERGEIQEQIHTNGHSVVGSQVDFESQQTIKSSSTSLSFTSHLILLMLCLKMF